MIRTADVLARCAALSNEERTQRLESLFRTMAATAGEIAVLLGEVERSQSFRDEGATSTSSWVAERFGVAGSTARALTRVGEKAWDLPHLVGSLCAGEVSFDKVRTVAPVATPETDRRLRDQAMEHSVRDLAALGRTTVRPGHDRRFLRFNDQCRTLTAQLPAEAYAETKACLESRARQVPTDGETPWDQRLCDGFFELIRSTVAGQGTSASPYMVVVHVPVEALVDDGPTELAGELEDGGLIDVETVQRIACDATVAVAVDDDVGHTMYEGRTQRLPTDAQRREVKRRDRECRFPGCTASTFTNVHHVVPWKPGGRTDLENLALLCMHHHHLVHSKGWSMSGNANEELVIVGPSARTMRSRPSPHWTRVTAGRRSATGYRASG
jgi:hypothetical protein